MTQPHVEPPHIPLIHETYDGKSDKDFVKLKLCSYSLLLMSDLYEFKIYLFDNGKPEEFLLFVRNFNMTLAAPGTLEAGAEIQYLCTPFRGELLCQFDYFSADVESTQTLNVEDVIKGLAHYFYPIHSLFKKNTMCRRMKKTRALTERCYAAPLIGINEYLASFLGANLNDKIGITELNKILLISMPNIWSRQAYVQGFYFESITF